MLFSTSSEIRALVYVHPSIFWSILRGNGAHIPDPDLESFKTRLSQSLTLIQCALGEVRVGKAMLKGQVVIRLAEVVAGRRRKQAKRASEEQRVVTSADVGYS